MNVSVVVPAFNAEATLSDTLESLLAQTHPHWEAVVVDDGSADGTARVARTYAARDPRIRLIQQANGGEAAARNAGLAHARHEWLHFLDADDWIAPEFLERMLGALEADPALDAVHCLYARVAINGIRVVYPYEPPAGDLFAAWARRSVFPVHACVVRRSLVVAVGPFDTSLRKSADWDLWQRVARTGARFGAVREILAYYRMQPHSASLDAPQMLADSLTVLRRGHAPDPRVPTPHPDHAAGLPPDGVRTEAYYLLSWHASIRLGQDWEAVSLFDALDVPPFPELHAEAVAECLYDAAPLALCKGHDAWEELCPRILPRVTEFLEALEARAEAPGLAGGARSGLIRRVLRSSPGWRPLLEEVEASGEEAGAAERERIAQERKVWLEERRCLREDRDELISERDRLREERPRLISERDRVLHSSEHQLGSLLLNGLRLRRPLSAAASVIKAVGHRAILARLGLERRLAGGERLVTTVCSNFPIYSQTFVYQEISGLARAGFSTRLLYSRLDARDQLPLQFGTLWPLRRRLLLDPRLHERDFAWYRRRFPDRVDTLIGKLCAASGLARQDLVTHANFLQAFSFTRMVEAYRPAYLHSYFFYDRSLMALVAGYLLDIPRGVSCYADHVLADYELKVVPLHLELCDIVVATSERIRRELIEAAPEVDHRRILVKPNGVDASRFPVQERREPPPGEPFRLVTVSRIEPKKGLLDLVDAVDLLRARGLQVEAHIVGAADDWSEASRTCKADLDRRITERNLWGTVHLEGRRSSEEVLRFLRIAHLFVAPFVETETGDKDGIPTALLEGMATGLPAVATDAGSISEVIEDGAQGLLVPQRSPAALADAIEALLRDPDRRAQLGRDAAASVRNRFEAGTCETRFHERVAAVLAEHRGIRP